MADGGPTGIFNPSVSTSGSQLWISTTKQQYWTNIPGCSFPWSLTSNIAYIPDQDTHGNLAWCSTCYIRATPTVTGSDGKLHLAINNTNIDAASKNAADYAALQLRKLGIYVYTIGLGSNGGVDKTLLARIANDPSSPIYDSSQPTGLFVFSPDATRLSSAFNTIASEVLRISQ
jgi:hypothetical protein